MFIFIIFSIQALVRLLSALQPGSPPLIVLSTRTWHNISNKKVQPHTATVWHNFSVQQCIANTLYSFFYSIFFLGNKCIFLLWKIIKMCKSAVFSFFFFFEGVFLKYISTYYAFTLLHFSAIYWIQREHKNNEHTHMCCRRPQLMPRQSQAEPSHGQMGPAS